jgi:hypothetical protein
MLSAVILASSLLAVVLVVALVREVRLRRALQRLLSRLLAMWRNRHAEDRSAVSTIVDDPIPDSGDRL